MATDGLNHQVLNRLMLEAVEITGSNLFKTESKVLLFYWLNRFARFARNSLKQNEDTFNQWEEWD
jgi:hypothetical protein